MAALQNRNIIILGRTGTGKKTIANKILGDERLQVDSAMTSVTREVRRMKAEEKVDDTNTMHYIIKIVDTLGPYSKKIDKAWILKEISEHCNCTGACDEIHLILFTFRYGVYEQREIDIFTAICELYPDEIPKISALVITGCESLDEEGRNSLCHELSTETITKRVVQLMKKGIVPVGFPNLKDIKPAFKEEYEKVIVSDANKLKDLVFKASESTFSRQLLQSKPPEMQARALRDRKKPEGECVLF
ncbi:GTPase IMAP family member 7-like [Acropora millepora]|uniref:GTPase IMAP family member 7-like n=1 Tax=Acropora millepora TaxID=45264 RepID=UPI001CF2BB58|nr:GTPase IMAP family member 7-like [Acropora millepora]